MPNVDKRLDKIEQALFKAFRKADKQFFKLLKFEIEKMQFPRITAGDISKLRIRQVINTVFKEIGFEGLIIELDKQFDKIEKISTKQLANEIGVGFSRLNQESVSALKKDFLNQALEQFATVTTAQKKALRKVFSKTVIGQTKDLNSLMKKIDLITGLPSAQRNSIVTTSIAGYDRAVVTTRANSVGIETFEYAGQKDKLNRPFCADRVKNIYTDTEADKWDNGEGIPANVFLGGYRCRHRKVYQALTEEEKRELDE